MKSNDGLSLVELIITVAIASVLLTVAVPGFSDMVRRNRVTTEVNRFVSSMKLSRSEAMKRGTRLTLCSSSDATICSDSTDWSTGWILIDSAGAVLQTWPSLINSLAFESTADSITVLDSGFQSGAAIAMQLTHATCYQDEGRTITISRVGHSTVETSSCPVS